MQFTLHCKRASNYTVWLVEFFMQSFCNVKKKKLQRKLQVPATNQFKLILLHVLAIFSRNSFFSLTIERLDVLFSKHLLHTLFHVATLQQLPGGCNATIALRLPEKVISELVNNNYLRFIGKVLKT